MKIKAAIFDMDGTIVNSLMFWENLWKRLGKEYMGDESFVPCDEVNTKVRTMIYTDAMAYFKEYYKLPCDTDEFVRHAADGVMDFYRDVARPKIGADALLASLKEQGIKLCLASATTMPEIKFALAHYGLAKYFEVVLSCAEMGVGKDKPDIYLEAVRLMGEQPSDVCVFEDSYVALETAKKAGFQTVGIYDKYNLEQTRLKNASDIYLDATQTLDCLIPLVQA